MGGLLAKRDEEKEDYNNARRRAHEYLQKCKPDYIEDEDLLGLAPDKEEEEGDDDHDQPEEEEQKEEVVEEEVKKGDDEDDFVEDPLLRMKAKLTKEIIEMRKAAAHGWRWRLMNITRSPYIPIDAEDEHGRTALYLASENGHTKCVEILIGNKANVAAETNLKWTPLHAAVFHGQVSCIDILLQSKASVNVRDKHGCTPLMFAVSSPKLFIVDLVSTKDRKKRLQDRLDAIKKLKELEDERNAKGKTAARAATSAPLTSLTAPNLVWKFYAERIEIVVMNKLISMGKRLEIDAVDHNRRTALLYAARYGRTFALSRLLDAKASLAYPDKDGQTPLSVAACNEHVEVADLLLRAGANLNATDQYFRTPLHGALEAGDERMATLLLKSDASVNAYDCEGRTPIMLAMDQANSRLFSQIVERKSNLDVLDKRGWNVVIYAIETGMLSDVFPLLLKLKSSVALILRAHDPQGRNSMHHSVQLTNLDLSLRTTKQLVNLDLEAATIGDCNGDTAIHSAAERGRMEVLRVFLDRMESADFLNNRGETPLHYAARGGHMGCVIMLLTDTTKTAPCDAGAVDSNGWNLLMHACVSGHLDLVNLLLQNRLGQHPELAITPIDVNFSDTHGVNALSIAAREGHWQLLPSLVLAGLNIASKDRDGFSALHWAAMEDEPITAKCLLDLGIDANANDAKGWTPLMHACARGADEAVRVLVDFNADADVRNWDGDTALQITSRRRDPPEVVSITKDILVDGILDQDQPAKGGSVTALGHFMVSVLEATDLYLEGSTGSVNAYVNLQLRSQTGARPQAAFTSCVLQNANPEWHEVFRFETTRMDPTAVLVAWVVAAPGGTIQEIMAGTEYGLNEDEIADLARLEAEARKPIPEVKPGFTSAIQSSFKKLMNREDAREDKEALRLRKLAMVQLSGTMPTEDLRWSEVQQKEGNARIFTNHRWNEVDNLREVLKRGGCDVPEPLVPKSHIPLGCVIVRFRHLRAAVWGDQPVTVVRTLRLSCRGSLRVQIDFRPKFFECKRDVAPGALTAEEEAEIYGLTSLNLDEETEMRELDMMEELTKPAARVNVAEKYGFDIGAVEAAINVTDPEEAMARANRQGHLKDPQAIAKKFRAVIKWSGVVLKVKDSSIKRAKKLNRPVKVFDTKAPKKEGPKLTKQIIDHLKSYQEWKDDRKSREIALDLPIGSALLAAADSDDDEDEQKKARPLITPQELAKEQLPRFKAERWVEDYIDGSRLI